MDTGPTWWVHQATRGSRENHQDCGGQNRWKRPKDHRGGASTELYGKGKGNLNNKINKNKAVYTFCKWSTCTIQIFIQEKSQLEKKLKENEQRLRLLELTDTTDATIAKRYKNDTRMNKPQPECIILLFYVFCLELFVQSSSENGFGKKPWNAHWV